MTGPVEALCVRWGADGEGGASSEAISMSTLCGTEVVDGLKSEEDGAEPAVAPFEQVSADALSLSRWGRL